MSERELNKTSKSGLNYRWDGLKGAPTLILSNSLGTNLSMWDAQVLSLAQDFRILRYDSRGHGESHAPQGPYSLTDLGRDVLAIMDEESIDQAFFCGLSLGGLTGLWLGIHAPTRFPKLVVCNMAPRIATPEIWSQRIEAIARNGLEPISRSSVDRWFSANFRLTHPEIVPWTQAQVLSASAEGYASCCCALRDADLWSAVDQIQSPTLIVAAEHDTVTTPEEAHRLSERISQSLVEVLPASHLSNVEVPSRFTKAVRSFLLI